MKIETKGTKLVIETESPKMSARQSHAFKRMLESSNLRTALSYLESFKGNTRNRVSVPRFSSQYSTDKISSRGNGEILALFNRMLDTDSSHKPYDSKTDWIGVEIECCIPFDSVDMSGDSDTETCDSCGGDGMDYDRCSCETDEQRDDCECSITCRSCNGEGSRTSDSSEESARGEVARMFQNEKIKYANIKDDGSISVPDSSYFAIEITVLTKLSQPENLLRACRLLNKMRATVNKSCGLHVHLDARHLDVTAIKKIGRNFERALPVMLAMVPKSRRGGNQYCSPSVSSLKGSRYHAVNLTAFKKYRTVEIRLHSSTTDFSKIISWARLCSAIAKTDRLKRSVANVNELADFATLDENLMEYVAQRTQHFSPDSTEMLQVIAPQFRDTDDTDSETQQIALGA